MSKESSYVFMLRAGGSELEVVYNEQNDQVYLSEAQLFLKGDHVEGGGLFFIDEVYDMDKLISYLSEIREKMVKHYEAKPAKSLAEAIASGPYCTECGKPQTKEEIGARISLCFDCEKKQIIQAADSFKPVVCMKCEGQFDNLLQKQLGICGKCMIDQANKNKAKAKPADDSLAICHHTGCESKCKPNSYFCVVHELLG